MSGALDGSVTVWVAWAPKDCHWRKFTAVARWHVHLEAVRCLDFDEQSGLALSAGDDGLIQLYRLRPAMRPLHTFLFRDGLPISEARFASRVPASIVAYSDGAGRSGGLVCVWALHGFLLASYELASTVLARGLRVLSEAGDAGEALLFSTSDGQVELRSLPGLEPVWSKPCYNNAWSSAADSSAARRLSLTSVQDSKLTWLGHADGTFEAVDVDVGGQP